MSASKHYDFRAPVDADEELSPGDDGLQFIELLDRGLWREAAQRLVDGDTIAAEYLSNEAALWLAACLPDSLRMDREGGCWHVRAEELP